LRGDRPSHYQSDEQRKCKNSMGHVGPFERDCVRAIAPDAQFRFNELNSAGLFEA
jgi:hypothetical protein